MNMRSIAVIALLAGAAACTTTSREQEIADLRKQLEEAKVQRAEAEAARVAAEKRAANAEKAAAERAALPETLFGQAQALEAEGKGREAVQFYIRAARMGLGRAALRLGEIYGKGIPGVALDYAEALKWYTVARTLGESVKLKPPS